MRRYGLYAVAVLIVGGLAWGGLVWAPGVKPDVATLVNAAEFQETQFGLHEKALEFVNRALEQEPDHAYAHVIGAKAAEGLGRWDESLRFYARAVALYPDEDRKRDLRLSVLRVLFLADRYGELESRARALLVEAPAPLASYFLGLVLERRGDATGALAAYEAATRGEGVFDAGVRRAVVLDHLGRREEAILALEACLRDPPVSQAGEAFLVLAKLKLAAGDRPGATRALLDGARVDPLLVRGNIRQNEVWNPLKSERALAPLLEPTPARAQE